MTETKRKRPWLAACLAFVCPGLGHVYLREWLRAVLWVSLVISTTALLLGQSATAPLDGGASVEGVLSIFRNISLNAPVALSAITVLSMVDAYWMATRENVKTEVVEGMKCPNCGKELEEELDFCHWCTAELEGPGETEEEPTFR